MILMDKVKNINYKKALVKGGLTILFLGMAAELYNEHVKVNNAENILKKFNDSNKSGVVRVMEDEGIALEKVTVTDRETKDEVKTYYSDITSEKVIKENLKSWEKLGYKPDTEVQLIGPLDKYYRNVMNR